MVSATQRFFHATRQDVWYDHSYLQWGVSVLQLLLNSQLARVIATGIPQTRPVNRHQPSMQGDPAVLAVGNATRLACG